MNTHTSKYKISLGIFVTGGLTLFVLAIFIIGKQKNLFNPVFRITTTFHNISGLQVGNNVRFSGINVGTVENIKIINDSSVLIDAIIQKEIQQFIRMDCEATIGAEGIIGDRVLIITQGSRKTRLIRNGERLASTEPVEPDAIMAKLKIAADNTEIITEQMAQILYKINSGKGTLGRLIQDSSIAENINQTIVNLKKSSKGLDENMNAAKSSFLFKGYYKKKEKAEIEKNGPFQKETSREIRKKKEKMADAKKKEEEAQKAKDINSNK